MKLNKCTKESFIVVGKDGSEALEGWKRWIIPGYEYIYVENEGNDTFSSVMSYLSENNIVIAGAAHDFNCPITGKGYIFFPIKRL